MNTGRALSKVEKESPGEKAGNRLGVEEHRLQEFEDRILNELRRVTDRLDRESPPKEPLSAATELKQNEDVFDELVRKATEAFFQGINSHDGDLQRIVDEVNNTPIEQGYESLLTRMEKRMINPWKEFSIELLSACIPVGLMFCFIYIIFKLVDSQPISGVLLTLAELAMFSVICVVVWAVMRSYITGADVMKKIVYPNARGALAAGCLLGSLLGFGSVYFQAQLSELWALASRYSVELAEQRLTDEAFDKFQRHVITNSFKEGNGKAKNGASFSSMQISRSDVSIEAGISGSIIQISEKTMDSDEGVVTARALGAKNVLEMKLKRRSAEIYLPQQQSEVLSKFMVGKLKSKKDGYVTLENKTDQIILPESELIAPFNAVRGKVVAIVYNPKDPDNHDKSIKRIGGMRILASSGKTPH